MLVYENRTPEGILTNLNDCERKMYPTCKLLKVAAKTLRNLQYLKHQSTCTSHWDG